MTKVNLEANILKVNDTKAEELRARFAQLGIKVLNLISSPGAGKTTILEQTLPRLKKRYKVAVIEGDVLTSRDAQRIEKLNVPVVQIETRGACHLDANMISRALESLDLQDLELIIIENVGNLVCPSSFDLGENAKVVVLSIAEGSDKVAKYPAIFTKAQACILNKMDLLSLSNFSLEDFHDDIKKVNPKLKIFKISACRETGLDEWLHWLKGMINDGGQKNPD